MASVKSAAKGGDEYMELVQEFALRPITSAAAHSRALLVARGLMDRPRLSKGATDYLDVLTSLIEQYEAEHEAIPPASDAELLALLMDSRGVTAQQVAEETGVVGSTLSAVRTGKRRLTREQVARVATYFGVSPNVFLGE